MDKRSNTGSGFRKTGARLALMALLVCVAASPAALAHGRGHGGGRVHFGVGLYFGAPVFGYPYYYPHYYYPPVIYSPPVVYSSPPVYVEQAPLQAEPQAQPAQAWWYYCAALGAYYPYVKECPGGWQRVSPTPPR